jgi:hypothetical protein
MSPAVPSPRTAVSRYVPAAAIAVVACAAGWLATVSLQQDFAAFWVAGAARRGGVDPYVNGLGASTPELWDGVAVFAHSRFLHPPIVAELFRPFAALPYAVAKLVFTVLAVAAWVGASVLAARAVATRGALALTLGAGVLFYPLYLHLERGQLDVFALLLLLVAFSARARPLLAGAALAAAITLKPALVGVLPIVAALGRWRVVGAALGGLFVVALVCVVGSGAALSREYAHYVLPRAALYGEGGDASMLLPAERLAARADDLEAGVARLGGRVYRQSAWDAPATASLPRLLAPERPTPLSTRAPAILLLVALVGAATLVRRRQRSEASETLLLWSAALACVVASPVGWIMGFVWALPLVPWLGRLRERGGVRPLAGGAWALAWVACALPPFVAGEAAVAATVLVAATVAVALRGEARSGELA